MGSRRLLPLLALLGAAGLQSSEWDGPSAPEPSTILEPEQALPGSAAPPSSPPFSTPVQRSLAVASADPELSPGRGLDDTAATGDGPAGGRTWPPQVLEAGSTTALGAPSAPQASWLSPPPPPSATASLLTLLPASALHPGSEPPTDLAGPTAGLSAAAAGVPHPGLGESPLGGRPGTVPSVLWDTREQVANWASWTEGGPWTPAPRSSSPAGGTAAGAARGADTAEGWRTPAVEPPWPSGASSQMPRESQGSPPTTETPGGRLLAPTWPPAEDSADPAPGGSPTPSEMLGLDGAATSALTPFAHLPPSHNSGSRSNASAVGLEPSPQPPGGSKAPVQLGLTPGRDPEMEPPEPAPVGEPLSLGTALPASLAGKGRTLEATEEAAALDSPAGSTMGAPGAPSTALGLEEILPPSAATPGQGAGGTEAAPHSSAGVAASPGLGGSAAPPSGSDPALRGGRPTPGPTSLALSVGPASPPADSVEGPGALGSGWDGSLTTAPPQSSAASGSAPPQAALDREGETWGSQAPPSPLSPWPAQPAPGPPPPPLQGASPGPACSSAETAARLAGAREEPQGAPPSPPEQPRGEGFVPEAAPVQPATDGPAMGAATEGVQPLVSQTPGSGVHAGQAPRPTGAPKSPGTALLSRGRGLLNRGPSDAAAASPSTEPASESGVSGGPGAAPAGAPHPGAPTESSAREKLAQAPHRTGPARTAATRPHYPPGPAPEPSRPSRSDPAVGSPRLLAPVPGEAPTRPAPAVHSDVHGGGRHAFVAENQLPLLKAPLLRVPCELVLAMAFSSSLRDPGSAEYQGLVLSINGTVTPLLAPLPGFQRLEVKSIRPGSVVVVEFEALFLAEALGLWAALNRSWLGERLPPGLRLAGAKVLRSTALERQLDLCALLFACHAGYECIAGADGNAACTSLCHRDYCQNQGICTHQANHAPVCQCPVGSDFWYLGLRCNYKVTQQGLLGVACGLLLSLVLVGAAVASLVIRRVRLLLLEARADQTKSSYRRFCRLDDVSAHYWSEPWLASASSLDNPAFSNSEELLHLQILDPGCCGCHDDGGAPSSCCKPTQDTPGISAAGRPSVPFGWASSSTSVNDPMVDSGKASEVSVSSWPLEPLQWSPFPQKLSGQQAHKSPPRPHSYCEGMELVSLERSWTA